MYSNNRNTWISTSFDILIKHDQKRGNTTDSKSIRLRQNMNDFSSCNIKLHKGKYEILKQGNILIDSSWPARKMWIQIVNQMEYQSRRLILCRNYAWWKYNARDRHQQIREYNINWKRKQTEMFVLRKRLHLTWLLLLFQT